MVNAQSAVFPGFEFPILSGRFFQRGGVRFFVICVCTFRHGIAAHGGHVSGVGVGGIVRHVFVFGVFDIFQSFDAGGVRFVVQTRRRRGRLFRTVRRVFQAFFKLFGKRRDVFVQSVGVHAGGNAFVKRRRHNGGHFFFHFFGGQTLTQKIQIHIAQTVEQLLRRFTRSVFCKSDKGIRQGFLFSDIFSRACLFRHRVAADGRQIFRRRARSRLLFRRGRLHIVLNGFLFRRFCFVLRIRHLPVFGLRTDVRCFLRLFRRYPTGNTIGERLHQPFVLILHGRQQFFGRFAAFFSGRSERTPLIRNFFAVGIVFVRMFIPRIQLTAVIVITGRISGSSLFVQQFRRRHSAGMRDGRNGTSVGAVEFFGTHGTVVFIKERMFGTVFVINRFAVQHAVFVIGSGFHIAVFVKAFVRQHSSVRRAFHDMITAVLPHNLFGYVFVRVLSVNGLDFGVFRQIFFGFPRIFAFEKFVMTRPEPFFTFGQT